MIRPIAAACRMPVEKKTFIEKNRKDDRIVLHDLHERGGR
jgi:hypothetical protein